MRIDESLALVVCHPNECHPNHLCCAIPPNCIHSLRSSAFCGDVVRFEATSAAAGQHDNDANDDDDNNDDHRRSGDVGDDDDDNQCQQSDDAGDRTADAAFADRAGQSPRNSGR